MSQGHNPLPSSKKVHLCLLWRRNNASRKLHLGDPSSALIGAHDFCTAYLARPFLLLLPLQSPSTLPTFQVKKESHPAVENNEMLDSIESFCE